MTQILSHEKRDEMFPTLAGRSEQNPNRHKGIKWADVKAKLAKADAKLWSLHEMERTEQWLRFSDRPKSDAAFY